MMAQKTFRIRSFVGRNSRQTPAQKRAQIEGLPQFGLQIESGLLALDAVFQRKAPRLLEIGFGSGQSLLALAQDRPDLDFIAIETHQPGIGSLLMGIQEMQLTNIRVFNADSVEVLEQCIPNHSLQSIQIFFPDPWQKRRHHARRLIQTDFIQLLIKKLTTTGSLHFATDWEDYAEHMMQVLSAETQLINLAGPQQFATRSIYRPIETKFERRALREGRKIRELQFQVVAP